MPSLLGVIVIIIIILLLHTASMIKRKPASISMHLDEKDKGKRRQPRKTAEANKKSLWCREDNSGARILFHPPVRQPRLPIT
ncbi:hypothetical protein F5X96DRAFT_623514 [Biscogniauxia mediterranea]|nr:hypothetical protein F5X96DRAFT_623514 [Biscogniauxia mediterranea]